MRVEEQLDLISRAWTVPDDDGYCVFMPWIPGDVPAGESRGKHWRESEAFRWPKDREKILAHMRAHRGDDLFWTPVLYDGEARVKELVAENHCLYADLDEVDPRSLADDLRPTVAWRTSPGRYQALWILEGDIVGAADEGAENHRLTYLVGADRGGWDSTQVLRIPGWRNHKAEYRDEGDGRGPLGKLLWADGPVYDVKRFEDLPEVMTLRDVEDVLDEEINAVDRSRLLKEWKLRIPRRVWTLLFMHDDQGADRSETLWDIERSLADIGMTAAQIVAVVRETVWNKYRGRSDEMFRLKTEAAKAVASRPEKVRESLEEERQNKVEIKRLWVWVRDFRDPEWMIEHMWSVNNHGVLAAETESFKTWLGMNIAFCVATGRPLMGEFEIVRPGRVLYIQEEDSQSLIRQKTAGLAGVDPRFFLDGKKPPTEWPVSRMPPFDMAVMPGLDLSDVDDLVELRDAVHDQGGYDLIIVDPLNRVVGATDLYKPEIATQVLVPLSKMLGHTTSLMVIHHMSDKPGNKASGGSRMIGSAFIRAWSRDSIYLHKEEDQRVRMYRESKIDAPRSWVFKPVIVDGLWHPTLLDESDDRGETESRPKTAGRKSGKVEDFLRMNPDEEYSNAELIDLLNLAPSSVSGQCNRLRKEGKVRKTDSGRWIWSGGD